MGVDSIRPRARVPLTLTELFAGEEAAIFPVGAPLWVSGLEIDSRLIRPGDVFAALPGHLTHGAAFAQRAVERGAAVILTDPSGVAVLSEIGVPVIVLENPRARLGWLAARLFGTDSLGASPLLLGVTGTNGKTTVAHLVDAGLRASGRRTGLVGTLGVRVGDREWPTGRTTPEAPHLHALLAGMQQDQVEAVTMEVSSHALAEGRVNGLRFAVVGFTHLSQDHLDYHGSMEAYFEAKAGLFNPDRAECGVVGVDDRWGRQLAREALIPVSTWSATGQDAQWSLGPATTPGTGVGLVNRTIEIRGPHGHRQVITHSLLGDFNQANILCAYVMLMDAGVFGEQAAQGISTVIVPGRMEIVDVGGEITGVVDYAHTPDAIDRAISSVRRTCEGRVIVVVGAGGDRDREKRPLMGQAAARLADHVIVTDDNPRSEDAALIRAAVVEGTSRVLTTGGANGAHVMEIGDRREAITTAVNLAREGDVVLILGKGHEQGQEQAGVTVAFDDRVELRAALVGKGHS